VSKITKDIGDSYLKYTASQIDHNMNMSVWHGVTSTISQTLVNGYIPLFAISVLGATNQQMGLISSLPSIISMMAMIPGAILLNRMASKKSFTALTTFATRLLFMMIMFIPWVPMDNPAWLLVGLIALLNFPGALSGLSWQTMIGDLIPEDKRGGFFSSRNRIITIVALFITFATGFFLERFEKSNAFPYQILIAIGFVFAVLEVIFLMKHQEVKTEKVEKVKRTGFSLGVFRHKPYLAFVCCALFYNFAAQIAWSVFSIYQIRDAHATALWLSMFSVTNQLAQIVSIKYWGKLADRYSNTMLLCIGAAGMATAPFLTVLSTNLVYITLINLWIGVFVSGTTMILFNQLLKVSPEDNRTTYIANYNILLALIGFIAPQAGVYFLSHFGMFYAMSLFSVLRLLAGLSFLFVAVRFEKKWTAPVPAVQLN
jgi:MFS family permease